MRSEPYYQDKEAGITLYCGDCRQILPELPKVDLVLTDPPYGIDYQSARRTGNQRKKKIIGDKEFPLWMFELIKPQNAAFVFCRWDILSVLPPPKSLIVWDKCRHSMGDLSHEYGRQWEACAFYPFSNHEFKYRPIDILRIPCIPANELKHPNEKPVALLKEILFPNKGDLILDLFMGSGTTLVAAKQLGRKAIGIEIEEKYCQIAVNRLRQTVMTLDIPEPENKQQALL